MIGFLSHGLWSILYNHGPDNSSTVTVLFLYFENQKKSGTYENCDVSCAIWEEIFEDIDDTLKDLKATDDIIKSDLTRLNIENVEQNNRLQTVEDQAGLLESENRVLESSFKALEARLDILEEHSGKGLPVD